MNQATAQALAAQFNRNNPADFDLQPLEWAPLFAAMDAQPEEWIPTTESMYWEMLECVPPRAMTPSSFLVGEALRTNESGQEVYSCFKQFGYRFLAKNMTVAEFKSLGAAI